MNATAQNIQTGILQLVLAGAHLHSVLATFQRNYTLSANTWSAIENQVMRTFLLTRGN